jgi:hypothetical protein
MKMKTTRALSKAVWGSFLLLVLLLIPATLKSQMTISHEPEPVVEVFEAMYRYDFPDAEARIKALNATDVSDNWIDLAYANLYWWELISGDESREYDYLMEALLNRVIRRTGAQPADRLNNEEVFTMIHSYAYLTRVDIYQERYFRGIVNLRHTLDFLDIALDKAAEYDKFLMVSGLYNYFAAVTLDKYPVFTPFFAFAPKSDRDLGFRQLSECSRMDNLLIRNESLYYLMKINYQLEEDYEGALAIADGLIARYPNNLIYHFHRFSILIEAGRRAQALDAFKRLKEVSASAPGLNAAQRTHLVDEAVRRLKKEKINPAI